MDFYVVDAKTGENRGSIIIDEYDEAAQDSYDNLVRACIKAGGDLREARELLARSLETLYLLGYDSGYTNPTIDTLTNDIRNFLEETA